MESIVLFCFKCVCILAKKKKDKQREKESNLTIMALPLALIPLSARFLDSSATAWSTASIYEDHCWGSVVVSIETCRLPAAGEQ